MRRPSARGRWAVPCDSPTREIGIPIPAPDLVVRRPFALLGLFPLRSNRLVPQKLPLLAPSGAVRGLRWLLVRVPLLRTICGHSAKTGATRATRSPKSERGTFGANKFARKVPRSLSRLRRASPPYPMRDGQHRAQSTDKPAWSAHPCSHRLRRLALSGSGDIRAAYAYGFGYFRASRSNHSPLRGTLTGHDHGRQQDAGRRVAV